MKKKLIAALLVALAFGILAAGIYGLFLRMPTPWFWAILVAAMAPVAIASRLLRKEKDDRDILKDWRDWRVIKDLSFQWSGEQSCMLTLQLAEDRVAGPVRVLRFHDVQQMNWSQLWHECLLFDAAGFDLGENRTDGMRYRMEDRFNETFHFVCSSYEELPAGERAEIA